MSSLIDLIRSHPGASQAQLSAIAKSQQAAAPISPSPNIQSHVDMSTTVAAYARLTQGTGGAIQAPQIQIQRQVVTGGPVVVPVPVTPFTPTVGPAVVGPPGLNQPIGGSLIGGPTPAQIGAQGQALVTQGVVGIWNLIRNPFGTLPTIENVPQYGTPTTTRPTPFFVQGQQDVVHLTDVVQAHVARVTQPAEPMFGSLTISQARQAIQNIPRGPVLIPPAGFGGGGGPILTPTVQPGGGAGGPSTTIGLADIITTQVTRGGGGPTTTPAGGFPRLPTQQPEKPGGAASVSLGEQLGIGAVGGPTPGGGTPGIPPGGGRDVCRDSAGNLVPCPGEFPGDGGLGGLLGNVLAKLALLLLLALLAAADDKKKKKKEDWEERGFADKRPQFKELEWL